MEDQRFFTSTDIKNLINETFFKVYAGKLSVIKSGRFEIMKINNNNNIIQNIYNDVIISTSRRIYLFHSFDLNIIKIIYDDLYKKKNRVSLKSKRKFLDNNKADYSILCEFNKRVLIKDPLAIQNLRIFSSNNKFCYYKMLDNTGEDYDLKSL